MNVKRVSCQVSVKRGCPVMGTGGRKTWWWLSVSACPVMGVDVLVVRFDVSVPCHVWWRHSRPPWWWLSVSWWWLSVSVTFEAS